jgi:SH3 domain protein
VKKIIVALFIALPLFVSLTVSAETTRFVSDELEITMRTGQGVKFGIRKMLPSGTKLEVIETDPAGYSKVRTNNGIDGWVLTRYLSNIPSARNSLVASEQKVANLELEIAKYKEEVQALSSQSTDANSENMTLTETSQRLSKELDDLRRTASNAVALNNENRQLKEKLQQSDDQMQSLEIENNSLKDSSAKSWFLIGAAVLFGGLLLGLILPRLRFQKKESWSSF